MTAISKHATDYIESWSKLAGRRGGDFIIHRIGAAKITVVLGDVCGHGEAAGDVADQVRDMISADLDERVTETRLREWHRRIFNLYGDEHIYVCLTLLEFDLKTQQLRILNCGNPDLIVHHRARSGMDRFTSTGMPLGIVEEKDWSPPRSQWTYLSPSDYAMGLSDGILDYQRADSERFGWTRLCAALQATNASDSPLREVRRRLMGFGPARADRDDLSMFVLHGAGKRVA